MATPGKYDQEGGGRTPGEEPLFIRQCLQELHTSKVEFPIKVLGAQTLPYASQVGALDGEDGLILKLIRPLPHELLAGALFEMVFSAGEQRFQGQITFQKRVAYLTYHFSAPTLLVLSDRRRHKRYPFRPREMADVLAQDATSPGHGLTGPLVNLSMGGLAFRVDRIVKLDDGLRIPATTVFFDKGKGLPLLRVRNLPRVPVLDARGSIAHVEEVGGQVQLGVEFGDLTPENGGLLRQVIEIREKSFRTLPQSASEGRSEQPRQDSGRGVQPSSPEGEQQPQPKEEGAQALRILQRRSRNLYLVGRQEPQTEQLLGLVQELGYFRVESVQSAEQLGSRPAPDGQVPGLLLIPIGQGLETLQEVRRTQQGLGEWQKLPALFLSGELDPVAGLAEEATLRILPYPALGTSEWLQVLDHLAGIE